MRDFDRIYENFLIYEFFSTFKKNFFKLYPKSNRDNIKNNIGIISFNLSILKINISNFKRLLKLKPVNVLIFFILYLPMFFLLINQSNLLKVKKFFFQYKTFNFIYMSKLH